jgi:hypothetical protein
MLSEGDTRDYTGSDGMSLVHFVAACATYSLLFVVGVTNGRERDGVPSLYEWSACV